MINFDEFVDAIKDSVAEQGYEGFFPTLHFADSDGIQVRILECILSEEGEEMPAKQWASEFSGHSPVLFLAYRTGGRAVHLLRIEDCEVKAKIEIRVEPFAES